jgi:hypothetical protein
MALSHLGRCRTPADRRCWRDRGGGLRLQSRWRCCCRPPSACTHARTHTHAACPSGSGSGSWPDAMQPSLLLAGQHTRSVWMHQCWQWAAGGSTIDSSSRVARARVAFVDQLANAVKPVTISAVPKRILRDQTELAVDPRPTREVFVGTRCEKKTTRASSESVVST